MVFTLSRDGKAVVRADAALRCHERRIGEDDVGLVVPAVFVGEGVVFVDDGIGEMVEIHVHAREAAHERRDVVADDVFGEPLSLRAGEHVADAVVVLAARICL